jgi:hypothetical protein
VQWRSMSLRYSSLGSFTAIFPVYCLLIWLSLGLTRGFLLSIKIGVVHILKAPALVRIIGVWPPSWALIPRSRSPRRLHAQCCQNEDWIRSCARHQEDLRPLPPRTRRDEDFRRGSCFILEALPQQQVYYHVDTLCHTLFSCLHMHIQFDLLCIWNTADCRNISSASLGICHKHEKHGSIVLHVRRKMVRWKGLIEAFFECTVQG